jgi:membrane-associated phospholipid phosphatase
LSFEFDSSFVFRHSRFPTVSSFEFPPLSFSTTIPYFPRQMNPALVVLILLALCALLMLLERRGLRTTLSLTFKGDIKRESRWLAQYGQAVCTGVAMALIWQLDPRNRPMVLPLLAAVAATTIVATAIKRLVSRVRPGRENAGKFLGPSWTHANYRESFPSSHSAAAVALSVVLAALYPAGAATFWALALICACLRYLLDAHWPSDVLGGIAIGYGIAHATLRVFGIQ